MNRPPYTQFFPGLLLLATGVFCTSGRVREILDFRFGDDSTLQTIAYVVRVAGAFWLLTAAGFAAWRHFLAGMPAAPKSQETRPFSDSGE